MTRRDSRQLRELKELGIGRFSPLLDAEPTRPLNRAFVVKAKVWRYQGASAWHFANLPQAMAAEIRANFSTEKRGWGSIPVRVRIGDTEWETSLFPDRKSKSYLFAIKADVRKAEGLVDGSRIAAHLTIR